MIDIQELRIGNYISHVLHTAVKITGLRLNPVLDGDLKQIFCEEGGWLIPEHCSPIPLTPEILEKAGFVKSSGNSYLTRYRPKEDELDFISVVYAKEKNEYSFKVGIYNFACDYVHEFQNYFYFMTGGNPLQITL